MWARCDGDASSRLDVLVLGGAASQSEGLSSAGPWSPGTVFPIRWPQGIWLPKWWLGTPKASVPGTQSKTCHVLKVWAGVALLLPSSNNRSHWKTFLVDSGHGAIHPSSWWKVHLGKNLQPSWIPCNQSCCSHVTQCYSSAKNYVKEGGKAGWNVYAIEVNINYQQLDPNIKMLSLVAEKLSCFLL